jgi:hypothetical protein
MDVSKFIINSVDSLLPTQSTDGSFPAGHNGPYYDEELPLRNTAHILILLLKAHKLSGEERYRTAALKALDYILADDRRPMGASYWLRKKPEKDFSNGLIGQAWVIEALAYAAAELGDDALIRPAEEVFLLHPFDTELARWRVVNVDGSYDPVDMTFNHQLWFAAAGSYLSNNDEISFQVQQFLDKLDVNLQLYKSGLIVHTLGGLRYNKLPMKRRLKQAVKSLLLERGKPPYTNAVINKAIGYHAFNTYAFALIYLNKPDHRFWASETFSRMLDFLLTDVYREGLEYYAPDPAHANAKELPCNRFGYPYNPPGIEVAFTIQTFREHYGAGYKELAARWFNTQTEKKTGTDDEATLAARMYEAVRLSS